MLAGPPPATYRLRRQREGDLVRIGLSVAALAGALLMAAGAVRAADAPAPVTLYRHATLIDGTGGPGRPGMSVLVEGERIKAVAPDTGLAVPDGAKVIDL